MLLALKCLQQPGLRPRRPVDDAPKRTDVPPTFASSCRICFSSSHIRSFEKGIVSSFKRHRVRISCISMVTMLVSRTCSGNSPRPPMRCCCIKGWKLTSNAVIVRMTGKLPSLLSQVCILLVVLYWVNTVFDQPAVQDTVLLRSHHQTHCKRYEHI